MSLLLGCGLFHCYVVVESAAFKVKSLSSSQPMAMVCAQFIQLAGGKTYAENEAESLSLLEAGRESCATISVKVSTRSHLLTLLYICCFSLDDYISAENVSAASDFAAGR